MANHLKIFIIVSAIIFIELNNKYTNQNLIVIAHGGVYGVLKSMINGVIWSNKQKYLLGFAKYYIHHGGKMKNSSLQTFHYLPKVGIY